MSHYMDKKRSINSDFAFAEHIIQENRINLVDTLASANAGSIGEAKLANLLCVWLPASSNN